MEWTYTLSEAAKIIEIPKVGRNTLYQILRALDIVDEFNRPVKKYIDAGLLAQRTPVYIVNGHLSETPVTVVVGNRGLNFIEETVKEYLQINPKPKISHKVPDYNWVCEENDQDYWDKP